MAVLVPSTRLTVTNKDNRKNPHETVAVRTFTLTVADLVSLKAVDIPNINGRLIALVTSAPPIPTDTTFDVEIKDADGETVVDTTGIADDSIVRTDLTGSVYVCTGGNTLEVDFANDLADNTAEFDIRLEYTSIIIN